MNAEIVLATRIPGTQSGGLVTFHVTCPEYVHVQFRTHGRLAQNWKSHRAVRTDGFKAHYTPERFHEARTGMRGGSPVDDDFNHRAREIWDMAVANAFLSAKRLEDLNIAKEERNRLLPPPHLMEGIITATEHAWQAFLELRADADHADPAMVIIANIIAQKLQEASWSSTYIHYPLWTEDLRECGPDALLALAARIARISYGSFGPFDKEMERGVELWKNKHLSPFDQIAWTVPLAQARTSRLFCEKGDIIPFGFSWMTYRASHNDNDLLSYLRLEGMYGS